MITALWAIIWWVCQWTAMGGALFFVVHWLTRLIRTAASRHLVWAFGFAVLILFPLWDGARAWKTLSAETGCAGPTPNKVFASTGIVLLGTWVTGAIWILARTLAAKQTVKTWYAESEPFPLEYAQGAGLSAECLSKVDLRIAKDRTASLPVTWGVLKPVILLPQTALAWKRSRIRAVLSHELGHVRRFDNLVQMLGLFLCSVHWFNPLFWFAARRMEAEAEIAADDFVILQGVKASTYAQELLELVGELNMVTVRPEFGQTAMLKACTLQERFLAILDPKTRRGLISRKSLWCAVVILLATMLLGGLGHDASLTNKDTAPPSCVGSNT